jgi:hypothetical protein
MRSFDGGRHKRPFLDRRPPTHRPDDARLPTERQGQAHGYIRHLRDKPLVMYDLSIVKIKFQGQDGHGGIHAW